MLNAHVAPGAEKLLDCGGKLVVEIDCEALAGVIREDAHEHDCIVLDVSSLVVIAT